MLNKLKLRPAPTQFERKEGEFRNPNVAEINALIDDINQELQNIPEVGPSVFVAKISQSGLAVAPIATIMRNTIGTLTFERNDAGVYQVQLPDGYLPENTYPQFQISIQSVSVEQYCDVTVLPDGRLFLQVYDDTLNFVDGWEGFLKIEHYPQ